MYILASSIDSALAAAASAAGTILPSGRGAYTGESPLPLLLLLLLLLLSSSAAADADAAAGAKPASS